LTMEAAERDVVTADPAFHARAMANDLELLSRGTYGYIVETLRAAAAEIERPREIMGDKQDSAETEITGSYCE